MREYARLYIDGAWQVPSGQGMAEVIDPATEQAIGRVPLGAEADVERAVMAARRAFDGWSRTPSSVRAGYIRALVAQLKNRAAQMAEVITDELGMPVQWCQAVQVEGPIAGLEQYAELAGLMDEVREVGNSLVYREAVGVCAFINPWNYPLHQMIGKLAPALAAGCTVVVKPSQETPLHAFVLAEMIDAIGLPAGVFNLVSGPGAKVGEALARHPQVDMVSFTGSTRAGILVDKAAADTVKKVALELGGKSPNIILDGAPLEQAVAHGPAHQETLVTGVFEAIKHLERSRRDIGARDRMVRARVDRRLGRTRGGLGSRCGLGVARPEEFSERKQGQGASAGPWKAAGYNTRLPPDPVSPTGQAHAPIV